MAILQSLLDALRWDENETNQGSAGQPPAGEEIAEQVRLNGQPPGDAALAVWKNQWRRAVQKFADAVGVAQAAVDAAFLANIRRPYFSIPYVSVRHGGDVPDAAHYDEERIFTSLTPAHVYARNIPKNTLQVGSILRIRYGIKATAQDGTDDPEIRVRIGSDDLADWETNKDGAGRYTEPQIGPAVVPGSAAGAPGSVMVEIYLIVTKTQGGVIELSGHHRTQNTWASTTMEYAVLALTPFDPTIDQIIALSCMWGPAHGTADHIEALFFSVEIIEDGNAFPVLPFAP